MQEFFREYLQVHGYWVLFIGTFLEGEAILIFAGFLASQGHLSIYGVILSAFAGSSNFQLTVCPGYRLLRRNATPPRRSLCNSCDETPTLSTHH